MASADCNQGWGLAGRGGAEAARRGRRKTPPRANMAHVRQSRPDYDLGFQVKVLETIEVYHFSLDSGPVAQVCATGPTGPPDRKANRLCASQVCAKREQSFRWRTDFAQRHYAQRHYRLCSTQSQTVLNAITEKLGWYCFVKPYVEDVAKQGRAL